MKPTGIILYKGPSMIDGKPIVAIVTGLWKRSDNDKTGNMAQLWIIPEDVPPHEAVKTGQDFSVCGDCPLSGGNGCYVRTYQAPLAIWKAYHRGAYPTVEEGPPWEEIKPFRSAAYGDITALPEWAIATVANQIIRTGGTGYTHGWKGNHTPFLARTHMASVHNREEKEEANSRGYRTFRTMGPDDLPLADEILCPNYTHGVSCATCGLCGGSKTQAKNICIPAHGSKKAKLYSL